ncbi:MAG: hypothetical protein ABI207_06950 [Crocinitomicaceae bacterium]
MKLLPIFICFGGLFFTNNFYCQSTTQQSPKTESNSDFTISELTKAMLLKEGNTEAEIQTFVQEHPDEAAAEDYYYSKSFKVKPGQTYTNDQFLAIDITKLDQYRLDDQTVEVVDASSHLHLILDSKNDAAPMYQHLKYPNGPPDFTLKYQNQ